MACLYVSRFTFHVSKRPDSMNRFFFPLLIALLGTTLANHATGQVSPAATRSQPADAAPLVATFSVVGFDPATGDLGVAVQSKFFGVGSVVPWAKAGVGAIATQSWANTTYGPRGLEALAKGDAPDDVLKALTGADDDGAKRQVGCVDAKGRSASFTGKECK